MIEDQQNHEYWMQRALELAEPQGFVRIFLTIGNPIIRLLKKAAKRDIAEDYVVKLLNQIDTDTQPDIPDLSPRPLLVDPLSDRELEVLHLMAQDLSYQEIANQIVVSLNTVRTHVKNIYSKLMVHKRSQAISKASERNRTTTLDYKNSFRDKTWKSAADRMVVTWDHRGFGRSTDRADASGPVVASDDLLAICDALGIDRADLVAHAVRIHRIERPQPRSRLGVLSALGVALIAVGLLQRFPGWLLGLAGVGLIVLSQATVPGPEMVLVPFSPALRLLLIPGQTGILLVMYPFIPWLGVTLLGAALGKALAADRERAPGHA